jgi:hypothetical protein
MHLATIHPRNATRRLNNIVRWIFLVGILGCFFAMRSAYAFCEDSQGDNLTSHCHTSITAESLSFFRWTVQTFMRHHINDPDHETGLAYASDDHFDSCNFDESIQRINNRYFHNHILSWAYQRDKPLGVMNAFDQNLEVNAFDRGPLLFKALSRWADILHASQDFYAHSNWVELGFVHPETDLFDVGTSAWREISDDWTQIRDDVMTTQKLLPSDWVETGDITDRVPLIRTADGKFFRVLVSGIVTKWGFSNPKQPCPRRTPLGGGNVSMDHDDLNKDNARRPGHKLAAAMAVGQTRHEWCRMLRMTFDKGGSPAVAVPLTLFPTPESRAGVKPDGPHPGLSICGAIDRGPVPVKVIVKDIHVYQAAENGETQLFNFVLGAFTQDLRLSERSETVRVTVGKDGVVPKSELPTSIEFCIHKNHRLLVTLQSWREQSGLGGELDDGDAVLWGVTRSIGTQGENIAPHLGQTFQAPSDNPKYRDMDVTFEVSAGTMHCEVPDQTTRIQ